MILLEKEKICHDEEPLISLMHSVQGLLLSYSLNPSRGSFPDTNSKKLLVIKLKFLIKVSCVSLHGTEHLVKLQLQVSKCPGACTNSLDCKPQALRICVKSAQFSPNLVILLRSSLIPRWLSQMWISDCKCSYIHRSNSCFNKCVSFINP